MAKENQNETRTSIDELNDTLTNAVEQKLQNNKKSIIFGVAAIVAVAAVILFVVNSRQAGSVAADDAIGQADRTLIVEGNDTLALAQYMQVADNEGYDAGNRAKLQAAILLFEKGDYEKAIEYLNDYSAEEALIGAAAYSLQGDCYVNLEKYNEAIASFNKAISVSDDNDIYTPFFMMKQARVYRELKDYAKEAAVYEKIKKQYPAYAGAYQIDIDKYIERAKASKAE
ncbi:MAG: tetratricopeptide repeat protein [Muribaculaceae bacterium]|nr:tetratricopeptide repeat protein [Muribaculaceae bacterium]